MVDADDRAGGVLHGAAGGLMGWSGPAGVGLAGPIAGTNMAKPLKLPPITADMVQQWLADVKAPQTWDLTYLPNIVLNLEALRQQTPYRLEKEKKPIDRAQKAIDELRRALTALLSNHAFKMEEQYWTDNPGGAAADFQKRAADARTMLSSLVNISGRSPQNDVWVELARDAYQFYQWLVPPPLPNKVSAQPGNAAVLFISMAVRAMGAKPAASSRICQVVTAADLYEAEHGPVPTFSESGM